MSTPIDGPGRQHEWLRSQVESLGSGGDCGPTTGHTPALREAATIHAARLSPCQSVDASLSDL